MSFKIYFNDNIKKTKRHTVKRTNYFKFCRLCYMPRGTCEVHLFAWGGGVILKKGWEPLPYVLYVKGHIHSSEAATQTRHFEISLCFILF